MVRKLITSTKSVIFTAVAAISVAAFSFAPIAWAASNSFTLVPWTFVGAAGDCGTGTPAGTQGGVVSRWDSTTGNPAPSLLLQKNVLTTDCSAAGASITGVSGITLNELNFDYKTGEYCGAGAPRFNVVTNDNITHFFGCADGAQTPNTNGWTHVTFDPANPAQAFPVISSGETVNSIDIVFDEQGSTHIDNISVNNQVIGNPSTPTNKNQCKNGGFANFTDETGQPFRNQGQCIAFVNGNRNGLDVNVRNHTVVNITNANNQNASSGKATSNNNTTTGNASSGNASNSNSSTTSVVITSSF